MKAPLLLGVFIVIAGIQRVNAPKDPPPTFLLLVEILPLLLNGNSPLLSNTGLELLDVADSITTLPPVVGSQQQQPHLVRATQEHQGNVVSAVSIQPSQEPQPELHDDSTTPRTVADTSRYFPGYASQDVIDSITTPPLVIGSQQPLLVRATEEHQGDVVSAGSFQPSAETELHDDSTTPRTVTDTNTYFPDQDSQNAADSITTPPPVTQQQRQQQQQQQQPLLVRATQASDTDACTSSPRLTPTDQKVYFPLLDPQHQAIKKGGIRGKLEKASVVETRMVGGELDAVYREETGSAGNSSNDGTVIGTAPPDNPHQHTGYLLHGRDSTEYQNTLPSHIKVISNEVNPILFDIHTQTPVCVVERLTPKSIEVEGRQKAVAEFKVDERGLPPDLTERENARKNAIAIYDNQSEITRGHLAAAANHRNVSDEVAQELYRHTNIYPMRGGFNKGIWSYLEGRVRWIVNEHYNRSSQPVYVYTGPLYMANNPRTSLPVADFFFKVVIVVNSNGTVSYQAWAIPHLDIEPVDGYYSLKDYEVTLRYIEEYTGLNFYSDLHEKLTQNTISVAKKKVENRKKHKESQDQAPARGSPVLDGVCDMFSASNDGNLPISADDDDNQQFRVDDGDNQQVPVDDDDNQQVPVDDDDNQQVPVDDDDNQQFPVDDDENDE